MFQGKRELIKQVNWALRCYSPLGFQAVNEVKSKWTAAGYELRFDGGSAMIAHFEGRIVALAWQSMGDVARYQFAKDCDELLHRNVKELGHFDHGYLVSLFHLLKECDGDRRILMGQNIQFNDLMKLASSYEDGSGTIKIDLRNGKAIELNSLKEIEGMMDRLLKMIEAEKQPRTHFQDEQNPDKARRAYKHPAEDEWRRASMSI